jgi:hypothetical protein
LEVRGWGREGGGREKGGRKGGVVTQSLYAHMNKGNKKCVSAFLKLTINVLTIEYDI